MLLLGIVWRHRTRASSAADATDHTTIPSKDSCSIRTTRSLTTTTNEKKKKKKKKKKKMEMEKKKKEEEIAIHTHNQQHALRAIGNNHNCDNNRLDVLDEFLNNEPTNSMSIWISCCS